MSFPEAGPQAGTDEGAEARQFGFISVLVIAVLAAVQSADPAIMNIALTSVSKDLDLSGEGISLAASMGTLALAATVIAVGALADRIGVRRVIMGGLVLEIIGNLIVSVSPNLELLLLGRVIAGVGMGALFAGAFSMVPAIAGKKSISSIIGQWTGMLYLLLIVFSVVGSVLIGIDWRVAFYLVPAISLLMLIVVPFTLPETPKRGAAKFDGLGLGCLGIGMVALLLGVSFAATSLTSIKTLGALVAGVVFLGLFVVIEKKSSKAAFPIDLFKSPVFVAAVIAGIIWNFSDAGLLLQAANFWQQVVGVEPAVVGISQMPLLIAAVVAGFAGGALLARGRSPVVMMGVGFAFLVAGLLSVAFTTVDTTVVMFLPALIFVGIGMVLVAVVQAREYVAEAPPKYLSAVVSSRTAVGQLGYSLGVGLTSTIVAIGITTSDGKSTDPAVFSSAFNTAMLVSAIIVVIGGAVAVFLLARGLKRRPNDFAQEDPELVEL